MAPLKTLKPHAISTLLRHQTPLPQIRSTFNDTHRRTLSTNTQRLPPDTENKKESSTNSSLSALFKAAVGITENAQCDSTLTSQDEDEQVKKMLTKIEEEVRSMKGMKNLRRQKSVGLYSLFTYEPRKSHSMFSPYDEEVKKKKDTMVKSNKPKVAGVSGEMGLFVKCCLYEKGYLKDANFLLRGELHLDRLSTDYARGYLRAAAERFGKDHEELSKCLSESDLKRLALFGCPDASHKTTYAAKRLRSYFGIQEDIVCRACKLKRSCKYKFDTDTRKINELNTVDVMRILTLYSLDLVPPELTLPDEVKDSASKLLKQVVAYSQ